MSGISRIAKSNRQDSGCDFSIWFAVSSPLLGVLLAMLALAIFYC
jgi:hypothetical protein